MTRNLSDETFQQIGGLRIAGIMVAEQGAVAADTPIGDCLVLILESAAELIQLHGSALGLPVSSALEIAGRVIGSDLGHNK